MALSNFSVIKFKIDKSIEFVPSSFLNDDLSKSRYPTARLLPPDFEVLKRDPNYYPPDNWPNYKVKFYGSFGKLFMTAYNLI